MIDSAAARRSLKEFGSRGSAGPWGKSAVFMSRVSRGSEGVVPSVVLLDGDLGKGLVDLDVNQPPNLAATPGDEVCDCIVDVLLRRVRVGRRVREAVAAVSMFPYVRSMSYSSACC